MSGVSASIRFDAADYSAEQGAVKKEVISGLHPTCGSEQRDMPHPYWKPLGVRETLCLVSAHFDLLINVH
jgi:hypothetical protein